MSLQVQLENYNKIPNLIFDSEMMINYESGSFLTSVGTFFLNKLTAVKNFFIPNTEKYTIETDPFISECKRTYDLNKTIISKLGFPAVANDIIPWSDMFGKNLYDTTNILKDIAGEINSIYMDALDETETFITKVVADPSILKSSKAIRSSVTEYNKIVEGCNTRLNKILIKNTGKDRVTIKEAIPNLSSIDKIVATLEDIRDLDLYKKAIIADKMVNNIKNKIDILYNEISTAGSNGMVSKNVISLLALELETGAKIVTCSGTILLATSQAARITTSLIEHLKNKQG